jgi:hypothetical protein
MGVAVAVLLAAIAFGVGGFEMPVLWVVADMLLVTWALGFIARANKRAHWYRW